MRHSAFFILNIKRILQIILLLLLIGCATTSPPLMWTDNDILNVDADRVSLSDSSGQVVGYIDKSIVLMLSDINSMISNVADIEAELYIMTGDAPNASAWTERGINYITINFGMINLLENKDEFAFVIGHEIAHNILKHSMKASETKNNTDLLGTIVGIGLGLADVPLGNEAGEFGAHLINLKFNRDQEREADRFGIQYMIDAGYNPEGAISLHNKLIEASGNSMIPFLSTHPSGKERISNLQAIINEKNT